MIVYVTGVTGLAGAAIAEAVARRGHTVIGIGFKQEEPPAGVAKFFQCDLADEDAAIESVLNHFPEVIINAAAVSEPDRCERDPEASRAVNTALPRTLARIAHHLSARLIHLSTDMVFDGKSTRYRPDSPVSPVSEYGRQKLDAEREVLQAAPEFATVLRTTLLTGNSPGGKRSVHEKLFALWSSGEKARLFEDEIRQPCLAENLAEVVAELTERSDLFGVFHWAGAEELSRYEIGRRIAEYFKLPANLIEKTRIADDPKFAGRPANLTLDIGALTGKLKTCPLSFDEQLERLRVPKPFRAWYNSL